MYGYIQPAVSTVQFIDFFFGGGGELRIIFIPCEMFQCLLSL
jgi:hypothetical protein